MSASKVGHHPTAQQEPEYTIDSAFKERAKYWDNSIVTTTKRVPRALPSLDCEEARDGTVWGGGVSGGVDLLAQRGVDDKSG